MAAAFKNIFVEIVDKLGGLLPTLILKETE